MQNVGVVVSSYHNNTRRTSARGDPLCNGIQLPGEQTNHSRVLSGRTNLKRFHKEIEWLQRGRCIHTHTHTCIPVELTTLHGFPRQVRNHL